VFQFKFCTFAPAKVIIMIGKIVIGALIIAISVFFLCIKVFFKPQGTFTSMHIHDSEAMKQRGIHCVLDQDREQRQKSRLAVEEKSNIEE